MELHEPVRLFLSYAHEDEALRNKLEKHLKHLQRQRIITTWHDRQILPGKTWTHEIDVHLETDSIILLLVSPDFLASDYCYDNEMQTALERHGRGEACVIPIILRPCDWQHSPLKDLQCLPGDGKPVIEWDNLDAAFLDITNGLHRVIGQKQAVTLSPRDQQNRMRMLKLVRTIWIEGVLKRSLHQAALKALDLQEEPDALDNPWHLAVQETNRPSRSLPAGTSIVQVYDEADGLLLILGKPGAGKTTLLLELASTLLERAEKGKQQRIPVVFNLSSWAQKPQSLNAWMVEELWTKYDVHPKIGQYWIDTDQVLPLLDGLDEVAEKVRITCAQEINNYYRWRRKEDKDSPIVVCCRSTEYTALSKRSIRVKLKLRHAVSIRDLTDEQINTYLGQVGEQVKVLKQALNEDAELHRLARQPLMLNILTLAYQGEAAEDVPTGESHEKMQHTIFAKYIDRMLERRGQSKHWKQEQVRRWLTFLAKQMQQHDQTIFSVEKLQPTWLPDKSRPLYKWCLGPVIGLVSGLADGLVDGLSTGLGFGLMWGVIIMHIEEQFGMLPLRSQLPEHPSLSSNEGTWRSGKIGLVVALIGEPVGGLIWGLISWWFFGRLTGLVGELIFLPFLVLGPFVRHFLLRFFLSRQGDLPWRLIPFLDEAAGRLLLLKAGGSYMFMHRLLRDHFAALDESMPSESACLEGKTA